MDGLKVLSCLIFLFGFVFGNQPSQHLFLKQQSVFIPDWRNEILIPNGTALNSYYSFTNPEISNIQVNDSIQMQKTSSDASRVTFGKIVLESLGAAAGGTVIGLLCYKTTKDIIFWGGAITFTGVSFGLAGGTTLVGNLLMEPNGSFSKSLVGSTIGTALGSGVLVILCAAGGPGEPGPETNWTLVYCGLGLAALCPITGAVIGYNFKRSGCCLSEIDEQQNIEFCFDHLSKIPFKVQIVSIKF